MSAIHKMPAEPNKAEIELAREVYAELGRGAPRDIDTITAALARHEMRGWNAAIEKAIQEMRALGMAHAAHVIRALKREEKDHGQDKVL